MTVLVLFLLVAGVVATWPVGGARSVPPVGDSVPTVGPDDADVAGSATATSVDVVGPVLRLALWGSGSCPPRVTDVVQDGPDRAAVWVEVDDGGRDVCSADLVRQVEGVRLPRALVGVRPLEVVLVTTEDGADRATVVHVVG